MAELTSVTIQLKNEYESKLAVYQKNKTAYEERVRLTKLAKERARGTVNVDIWKANAISYQEVEDRFKVNMEVSYQDMIKAKNTYLSALEKENPEEYAIIKSAEAKASFAKKIPYIIGGVILITVLVIVAIKKGWLKFRK